MASPPAKRRSTRSALTATADNDTNNATTVHDHGVSLDSLQQEPSTPEVIKKMAHHSNSLALIKIHTILAHRCSEVNIYVGEIEHELKKCLIHRRHGMNAEQKYEVFEDYYLKIITSEMDKKWPSIVSAYDETSLYCYEKEKRHCLQYIWEVFQTVAEEMIYDNKKSEWICIADAVVPVLDSPSATVVNEKSHRSNLPENKEESVRSSQEEECQLDKPVENQQEDEATLENQLYETLSKYEVVNYEIAARMCSALKSQMCNSCGRDTITTILRCACAIAFGPHFERNKGAGVFIYQVGTSDYPFKGFPVSSLDEYELTARDGPQDVKSPVLKATMPLALQLSGYYSPPANVPCSTREPNLASPKSVSSGQESSKSLGKGCYIYPDLVVACESGDTNAKYLLLVEIESNACLSQSKAEALRQGVGALVGQKQVFSLTVSHMSACLLTVCRDDDAGVIAYNAKHYRLVKLKGADRVFDSEAWFMMFLDLIKVLDYAKESIVIG